MQRSILSLVVLLVSVAPAWATDKCGTVCDETWTASGNPYVLTCNVFVSAGCALTIEQSVSVQAQTGTYLYVEGTLDVNGAWGSFVTFTSDSASPAPGDWKGLIVGSMASATIDHAEIHHAEEGIDVNTRGGTLTLYQVTASDNEVGLSVTGTGGEAAAPIVTATHSSFIYNSWWGVFVSGGGTAPYPDVTIEDSNLFGNSSAHDLVFHMENPHEAVVKARNNYWGSLTDAETIEARTYGKVDWCGWRDSPGGPAVRDTHCPDLVVCDGTQYWSGIAKPHLLVDDVWVCPTGTLVVNSGVETLWRRGDDPDPDVRAELRVEGSLDVNGPPNASFVPDTDTPQPGDWGGIRVEAGGDAVIDYGLINYAVYGLFSRGTSTVSHAYAQRSLRDGIRVVAGSTTLTGVTSNWNGGNGLYVEKTIGLGATLVSSTSGQFVGNDGYGVEISRSGSIIVPPEVTINGATIRDNAGTYQVLADADFPGTSETVFDFRNNWWGTTDPEAIDALIHDHQDDADAAHVDWCGYLSAFPPSAPVRDAHCPDLVVCDGTARWDLTDKPYLLWEDIQVCPTGTLEIGPGVELRAQNIRFYATGSLDVQGTQAAPVTFRSDAAAPSPGDWRGLDFPADATGTISHATISHANQGISMWDHSQLVLRNVNVVDNHTGLLLDAFADPSPVLDAQSCRFTDNQDVGVWIGRAGLGVTPALNVSISDSEIHSNLGAYDLQVAAAFENAEELVINARRNWWGQPDPNLVASRIYDYSDNNRSALVDWCDVLMTAGGEPSGTEVCVSPYVCNGTVTWDRTDQPYLITSRVLVCPTGTLRIEPGVEVRSLATSPQAWVWVQGTLDVGDPAGPEVTFTSHADTPQSADWWGVVVEQSGQATLRRATIEYANRAIDATDSADVTLDGVTLRRNTTGIHLTGSGPPSATVTDSTITENESYGIYVRGEYTAENASLSIRQSAIHGNLGPYELYATYFSDPSTTIVDARYNWWGSADPAVFGPRIYDRRSSASSPHVDWCGFLEGPGGAQAIDAHCFGEFMICGQALAYSATDKPYLLVSDFDVCSTGSMRLDPGVEVQTVKTTPKPTFVVEGGFEARGEPGAPVTLTSAAVLRNPDDWSGLIFRGDGSRAITLANTEIRFAGTAMTVAGSAAVTLDGVVARNNFRGLLVFGTGPPSVSAVRSQFTGNTSYGVHLVGSSTSDDPAVSINHSSIHSNAGSYDFYTSNYQNPRETQVNARNNWWGSDDPVVFGNRIYDQRQAAASPFVDWCGYLGSEGASTPHRDVHCIDDYHVCDGESETWSLTDKPYQLVTDFIVCPTGRLDVGAGVEVHTVHTTPRPVFVVEGLLETHGTPADQVIFTSDDPTPAANDWTGLQVRGTGSALLNDTIINYANYGIDAGDSAWVVLDHVTASRNTRGLNIYGNGQPVVQAAGCSVTENTQYGVYVRGQPPAADPEVTINDSSIHGNLGPYDFYSSYFRDPLEALINARRNWWGSDDPAVFGGRIHDHRQLSTNPLVDWCDYLGSEGSGFPHRDLHCVDDYHICSETSRWDLTDKPYQLVTDFVVCPSGTLEVDPGVEIRTVHTSLRPIFRVEGALDVAGTSTRPVHFTSDDAYPAESDWSGLEFRGFGTGVLRNAHFNWAYEAIDAGGSSQVLLEGVTARRNRTGLYVWGDGGPSVNAAGCSFTENLAYGVYLRGYSGVNPNVTVTRSSLHSNSGPYDFYTYLFADAADTSVWATDNWWGTTDEAWIRTRIYDHVDSSTSPHVRYSAFGESCDPALGKDLDGDSLGDFEDNCPATSNLLQTDDDGDGMGNACDPAPGLVPVSICDGFDDVFDGYADADGDGWGDPCDIQPTRTDSYPGAPELCDGRDNDGTVTFALDELVDEDFDGAVACGDCDDLEAAAHYCHCELCSNGMDDDCDAFSDESDPDCQLHPDCIVLTTDPDLGMTVGKGECGGATLAGPFDIIRGSIPNLQFNSGSVDLGEVQCVAPALNWDRVTTWSPQPGIACDPQPLRFYVARNGGDPDFGSAYSGEARGQMTPDPPCP